LITALFPELFNHLRDRLFFLQGICESFLWRPLWDLVEQCPEALQILFFIQDLGRLEEDTAFDRLDGQIIALFDLARFPNFGRQGDLIIFLL
jgi:hypothetical protein